MTTYVVGQDEHYGNGCSETKVIKVEADWADTDQGVLRLWRTKPKFGQPDSLLVMGLAPGRWSWIKQEEEAGK